MENTEALARLKELFKDSDIVSAVNTAFFGAIAYADHHITGPDKKLNDELAKLIWRYRSPLGLTEDQISNAFGTAILVSSSALENQNTLKTFIETAYEDDVLRPNELANIFDRGIKRQNPIDYALATNPFAVNVVLRGLIESPRYHHLINTDIKTIENLIGAKSPLDDDLIKAIKSIMAANICLSSARSASKLTKVKMAVDPIQADTYFAAIRKMAGNFIRSNQPLNLDHLLSVAREEVIATAKPVVVPVI